VSFALGVEEELFLVDAETLEPAPLFSRVVPDPDERIKPELFECLVEITTPICRDADKVLEHLIALRREIAERAEHHGATILAAGMHPTARGEGQPIVPEPRYRELAAKLGGRVSRQLVCGLHVHVDVGDWNVGSRAYRGLVRWLPAILALSVNSPFDEGRESGPRSVRAGRLTELPTGGAPPADLPDDDRDFTRVHWDLRPNYRYGTLEVRIADQSTDVRRSAALAAIVQALVVRESGRRPERCDLERYREQRGAAAAGRLDPGELERLLALVPRAEKLLAGPSEADRQLALGPPDAVRDLADRSVEWLA
jgi:glutamate---cysteine ligase / carboxylate-amine ligase